jgi:hypothetical protein
MLLFFVAFCQSTSGQAREGIKIIVDDSFPTDLQPDLQAVANDVRAIVNDLFEGRTPPLDLPIVCYWKHPPGIGSTQLEAFPETTLDDIYKPTKIRIGLAVNGRYYAQFAYQLAHELGHVMLDPRRTNGVIETIASALAYELLDRIADRWEMAPSFPQWRGWGVNFRMYRTNDEQARLARFPDEVHSAVIQRDWPSLRRYLYRHRAEQNQTLQDEIQSIHGQDIQALGAISLRSSPVPWKRFVGISIACSSVPLSLQGGPQPPSAFSPKCLPALSGALCPIGRGCPGVIP